MDITRLAAQTFAQSLIVELRSVEGCPLPVAADLSYDSTDPYAATLTFHVTDTPVPWVFARDLLRNGLGEPTGDGDVHVWPSLNDEGLAVISIELCSPQGDALVEIRTADAAAFVERTFTTVAAGDESARLDLDATIAAILADENA
jgi:Streptomyces sporulation and cell division protein, SsgA